MVEILMILDDMAWLAFRMIAATQATIYEMFYILQKPKRLGEKIDAFGKIYAGWYIFQAKNRHSVPEIIRVRGLIVGKIVLGVILISTVIELARGIL